MGPNDGTVWLKSLSVVSLKECLTNGRIVDELEHRLPEEVARSDFAAIVDNDDIYIAR